MLNTQGELACAAAANLFWIAGERVFTPALDCGALDGIVRGAVLAAAERLGVEVVQTRTGPEALSGARAVFITNSLIGVRRASALGERALGDHPLVGALAAVV
jgi:branched-chain amino acid aminotransferase/4-amino-4-deoxychorismate lyase